MPFYLVEFEDSINKDEKDAPNQSKPQVPLFCVGGIGGVGGDWQQIIEKMRAAGDTRPVLVYYDPRNIADPKRPAFKDDASLQEQARIMVASMQDHLPPSATGPTKYLLAGFSFGCPLAAEAARLLIERGEQAMLCLVDGASPECSKEYFSTPSLDLVRDLAGIVTTMAKLALGHEVEIGIDFAQLKSLSPLDCMVEVEKRIRNHYPHINNIDNFNRLMRIARHSISTLLNYTPANIEATKSEKIDKIVLLTTNKTAEKYRSAYLGWENHTGQLSIVADDFLRSQEHTDLLSQECAPTLANIIGRFANQETAPTKILASNLIGYLEPRGRQPSPSHSPNSSRDSSPIPLQRSSPPDSPRTSDNGTHTPTAIESFSDAEEDGDLDEVLKMLEETKEKVLREREKQLREKQLREENLLREKQLREEQQLIEERVFREKQLRERQKLFGSRSQGITQSPPSRRKLPPQTQEAQQKAPSASPAVTVRA